jgi:predicted Rossmann fold flavoprotein
MLERRSIAFHEREQGRLFLDGSASQILDMLLDDCLKAGAVLAVNEPVSSIQRPGPVRGDQNRFLVLCPGREIHASSLVVATGGVSIPGAGASPFGYRVAEQFGIPVRPPRPGLVPLTLNPADRQVLSPLAGISVEARVSLRGRSFQDRLLFTHRGLSGPVILQASLFWEPGDEILIDLLPGQDLARTLTEEAGLRPKRHPGTLLGEKLPRRLADVRLSGLAADRPLGSLSRSLIRELAGAFHAWTLKPGGTEGYRTAEVTAGGVDCDAVSSKTMEAAQVPGLYFIGEVLDVTGLLGGYNLQWAWSSGWCAGQCA